MNEPASLQYFDYLLAKRRVLWFGHVLRSPDSHPTRRLVDFDPASAGWRRPRGAPRTRWLDVFRKDLERADIRWEEAPVLARDRREWRRIVQRFRLNALVARDLSK